MGIRKYSSVASEKIIATLLPATGDGYTNLVLEDVAGLPTIAEGSGDTFTMVLSPDTVNEEIVTVTAVTGAQLTITRAEEGTNPAKTHPVGNKARHMITGRDLQDAQNHFAASAAHNVTEVVGRTENQVLTGKTISGSSNTISNIAQSSVANLSSDLAAKASSADLTAHNDDTSVHGIADTSKLAKFGSSAAGRTIYVQATTPSGTFAVGDIWIDY